MAKPIAMAVHARTRVIVDERNGNIGKQDGKRDAVRVTAKAADEPYQQARQRAEDQAAAVSR